MPKLDFLLINLISKAWSYKFLSLRNLFLGSSYQKRFMGDDMTAFTNLLGLIRVVNPEHPEVTWLADAKNPGVFQASLPSPCLTSHLPILLSCSNCIPKSLSQRAQENPTGFYWNGSVCSHHSTFAGIPPTFGSSETTDTGAASLADASSGIREVVSSLSSWDVEPEQQRNS